jgi:MoxR-like ATPase
VLATQNPIEQEGTYPLPEAQLDRFMLKILVDYPAEEEEFAIVKMTTQPAEQTLERILAAKDILVLQEMVRRVPCADHVMRYAMRFSRWTRRTPNTDGDIPKFVKDYVAWGAGPRASQHLVMAGKARSILQGRYYVSTEDIRAMAHPVLRHRIITNFNAEADGIKSDTIVEWLIRDIPSDAATGVDPALAKRVFAKR